MNREVNGKNVIWLQLSAGQGPRECGWVVAQLLPQILQDADSYGLQADIVETQAFDKVLRKQDVIETDAYLSALVRLEGRAVQSFCGRWVGSIKWHGTSHYRPAHKRSNWFVGIAQVSVPSMQTITLDSLQKEVEMTSIRSQGPGGQHVNKTNSAVRLTHRPTGIQLRVDSDRSQHRNRQLALEQLQLMLADAEQQAGQQQVKERWLRHYQVSRGNPVRVFEGPEFIEKR